MDPERFDRLTSRISRRTSLLGLVLGGVAQVWHEKEAAGKKKKKCKQGKKCRGKVCGNFGCKGKSCGDCPSGQTCNGQGQCFTPCFPQCDGKTCGPDGCGGTCGSCDTPNVCTSRMCLPEGTCSNHMITPAGTPCGTSNRQCFQGGCFEEPTCEPVGKTCTIGSLDQCCAGTCETGVCAISTLADLCHVNSDCDGGLHCIGYHCLNP